MLINLFFRKYDNKDGNGDPTAFFPDVLTCLRLPACDQLLILDCCFAAKAFAREHIGKRKFELLTSAAHDATSPAPKSEHSFTRTLTTALRSLLKENPKGFCTSHLYREVYHTISPHPATTKPLLFDQSRHNFGKIWLMPQVLSERPPKTEEEGRFLKLTFRLNENPDLAVMNELALNLQFLPYVDQIKFDDLYAPREQITNFMKAVVQAQKLKPLIKKMQARRKLQKVAELKTGDNRVGASKSLLKLYLEQNNHPVYDWSRAERVPGHNPKDSEESRDKRKKTRTWPPAHGKSSMSGSSSGDTLSAEYKVEVPGTLVATFVPRRANTMDALAHEKANGTFCSAFYHPQLGGSNTYCRSSDRRLYGHRSSSGERWPQTPTKHVARSRHSTREESSQGRLTSRYVRRTMPWTESLAQTRLWASLGFRKAAPSKRSHTERKMLYRVLQRAFLLLLAHGEFICVVHFYASLILDIERHNDNCCLWTVSW